MNEFDYARMVQEAQLAADQQPFMMAGLLPKLGKALGRTPEPKVEIIRSRTGIGGWGEGAHVGVTVDGQPLLDKFGNWRRFKTGEAADKAARKSILSTPPETSPIGRE